MLLADKVSHALLFEPNPAAADRARENVRLNRLEFEVHEVALSDEDGMVTFENAGGANPCNRTVVGFSTTAPTITVPRFTLDNFLAQHEPLPEPITAVKIDVEGHEGFVLEGLHHSLSLPECRLVCCEIHPALLPHPMTKETVVQTLKNLGFNAENVLRRARKLLD